MIVQEKLFETNSESDKEEKKNSYSVILNYIPTGKEYAISMKHLAHLLNTTPRQIRSMVHHARCEGSVIVADDNGYYLPVSQEELTAWIRRYEASARSVFKALASAKTALAEGRYPKAEDE